MPIYEFYCKKCNTVYKFFSKSVNTQKVPRCPACRDTKLRRVMSQFATLKTRGEDQSGDQPMPDIDEGRLEKAMEMLASEAEGINEDDPRQAARLMRKLTDMTGMSLGPGMEEAMSRMERGEDPDKIEEEMGDLLEGDEPFIAGGGGRKVPRKKAPRLDETLYEL
jgi:putative FmdB family regulatory protein